jgi:hypothetical protein
MAKPKTAVVCTVLEFDGDDVWLIKADSGVGSRLAFAVFKRFSSKVIERTPRAWARPMNHETMGTNWQEARVRSLES